MGINISDYLNEPEKFEFLYHLKNCKPTHYSDDSELLKNSFKESNFYAYPSSIYPERLVLDMCITFVKKFATYNPGKEQSIEKIFFVSMPLAILSKSETASDRMLIWGNGMIVLTEEDELVLFIDQDLGDRLLRL